MSEWISTGERLPEHRKHILMTDGQQIAIGWLNQFNQFMQVNTWTDLTDKITYWQYLPKPPEDDR